MLASHYDANPEMMSYLLDVAEANNKPVVAVAHFGGSTETPADLVDRVKEHTQWNSRDIADAIKRQARLEDTSRWDVIDFP